MKFKKREKVATLYILHGEEEPEDIVKSLEEAGISNVEIMVISGSLRPSVYFPFIKDEEGRPYYGRDGIDFYLERARREQYGYSGIL